MFANRSFRICPLMMNSGFKETTVLYSDIEFKSRKLFGIKGTVPINCSSKKIWNTLTQPGHLEKIHPFCEHHERIAYNGIGDKDSGRFASGKEVVREIVAWETGKSYTVLLKDLKKKETNITFSIEEMDTEKVNFSVHIQTKSFKNIPRIIWPWFAKRKILPVFKNYLHSLLNGTKYHLETGNNVSPNQFGPLKGYSKK